MEMMEIMVQDPETFLRNNGVAAFAHLLTKSSNDIDPLVIPILVAKCMKIHPGFWLSVRNELKPEIPPFQLLIGPAGAENEPPLSKRRRLQKGRFYLCKG